MWPAGAAQLTDGPRLPDACSFCSNSPSAAEIRCHALTRSYQNMRAPVTLPIHWDSAVAGLGINSSILSFSSFHTSEPTGVATFPGPLPGLAAPLPQASCRMPHASCRMPLDPLSPLLTRPWMLCQAFATHTTLLLLDHDARPYDQDLLARARQALAPEDEQPAHQAGKHAR